MTDDRDDPDASRTLAPWLAPTVLVVAVVLLVAVGIGRLHGSGADTIHDPATLPERLEACGRTWHSPSSSISLAAIRAPGLEPPLVDMAPLAPCPAAIHPTADSTATAVMIRVGPDAYVVYSLVGGP